MAVDASFYKNVSLLMQVVPASFECVKHFKKGMFDKPNTSGFIQISHYLLSIYGTKDFQRMVVWPIMNKTDEKKYRMEVKEYLKIAASENPDIKFPPILISHLLQAGGMKFLFLMWKISEISLRAHIKRKYQIELLQAPNTENDKEIIQTYFTTMNAKKDQLISKLLSKMKLVNETFEYYMQCKCNDLKKIQIAIFEVKENIEKLVPMLPVNPMIATRLTDIDDEEIINLWKISIDQNIEGLNKKSLPLRELTVLSNKLSNIILGLCVEAKFFDGNDLPKIKYELLPLHLTNNKQLDNHGLYKDGCLIFHVVTLIFHRALKQIESYLKADELPDLSNYETQITEHYKVVKSMEGTFQNLIVQVSDNLYELLCNLQEKTMNYTLDPDFLHYMCLETVLISPRINFSNIEDIDDEKLLKGHLISPLKGKYKHLFKRYNRNFIDSSVSFAKEYEINASTKCTAPKWKSPRRQSFTYKRNSPNKLSVSPRYSRLFSINDSKRNYFKDQVASTPNPCRRSLIPRNLNMQNPNTNVINMDAAMKNIWDLSCRITDAVASLSKS